MLEKQPFKVERTYYKLVEQKDKNGHLTYKKTPLRFDDIKSGDNVLRHIFLAKSYYHMSCQHLALMYKIHADE